LADESPNAGPDQPIHQRAGLIACRSRWQRTISPDHVSLRSTHRRGPRGQPCADPGRGSGATAVQL